MKGSSFSQVCWVINAEVIWFSTSGRQGRTFSITLNSDRRSLEVFFPLFLPDHCYSIANCECSTWFINWDTDKESDAN